jgi:hypothetical protein
MYFHDNSSRFVSATMLNFCPNGICFQTTPPVTPGEKIRIITEETPGGMMWEKAGEEIVGEVMWCSKKAGAHRVGVQYLDYSSSDGLFEH